MAFHSGARKPFESGITKDQLFWWIDGHDPVGYPGSGTTMYDLVGSRNMTITGATHQTTAINSFFDFDGGSNEFSLSTTDFRFQTSFSCDCWFNIDAFDQNWFRLVDYCDNNTAKLYLNGALVDSGNTSGTLNDWSETELLVGSSSSTEAFNGQIGPVRVYTKALTASEVLKNYTVERTRFGV